jgi:hypothetical protein
MISIRTSAAICEEFKDELAKLIPDIIRNCLTSTDMIEAEYAKKLENVIEKTFQYVSDFKFALEWMGIDTEFLNRPPYNQNGMYSWKATFETMKNTEECRKILDTIVNKIIEIDCNSSVRRYEEEKGNIGFENSPY